MAQIRRPKREEAHHVCFSKRRVKLFEKASELAILCGVEVAIISFSPTGKAYSFGHPSVKAILERFAPTGARCRGGGASAGENGQLAERRRRYKELMVMVASEEARKKRVEAAMEKECAEAVSPVVAWLEADIRDLGEEELIAYGAALTEVQAVLKNYSPNMDIQIQEQMRMAMKIPPPPGFAPTPVWPSNDAAAGVQLPGPC